MEYDGYFSCQLEEDMFYEWAHEMEREPNGWTTIPHGVVEITTDPAEAPADCLAYWRPNGPVQCMADLRCWVASVRSLERSFPDGVPLTLTNDEAFLFAQSAPCRRPVCADLYGVRVREECNEDMEVPPASWRMVVNAAPLQREVKAEWVADKPKATCPKCNGSGRVCGVFFADAWTCETCNGNGVV